MKSKVGRWFPRCRKLLIAEDLEAAKDLSIIKPVFLAVLWTMTIIPCFVHFIVGVAENSFVVSIEVMSAKYADVVKGLHNVKIFLWRFSSDLLVFHAANFITLSITCSWRLLCKFLFHIRGMFLFSKWLCFVRQRTTPSFQAEYLYCLLLRMQTKLVKSYIRRLNDSTMMTFL